MIKKNNGFKENRYKVKTEIIFFSKTYKINLTLSTKEGIKFMVNVDLENASFNKNCNEYSYTL